MGELGEAHDLDLIEHRDALGAVAIGPLNVVVFAARGLDEVFEESLVVGRRSVMGRSWRGGAGEVKAGGGALSPAP